MMNPALVILDNLPQSLRRVQSQDLRFETQIQD